MNNKNKSVIIFMMMFIVSLSFGLAVSDTSDISLITVDMINQNPTTAVAGEIVEINFGFENLGGQNVENLMFEIDADYPFKLVSDEVVEIGSIYGYQYDNNNKIEEIKLLVDKEATKGTYELKVKYYEEDSNVVSIEYFDIEVVGRNTAQMITINETQLNLGEVTPVTFTINNLGSTALKNVNFEWSEDTNSILSIGSDNSRYISYLDIKDSEEFEFDIVTGSEVTPGVYSLKLKLTYEDPITLTEQIVETTTGVYVGGNTEFDIILSDITSSDYTFTIMNVGNTPAYSISMEVLNENGWSTDTINTLVLGNLDSGDYTSTSITLNSNPKSENLNLNLYYTNSNGKRLEVLKEIEFSSEDSIQNMTFNQDGQIDRDSMRAQMMASGQMPGQTSNTSLWSQYKYYILVFVGLIFVFVGYRAYRKRKISKMLN